MNNPTQARSSYSFNMPLKSPANQHLNTFWTLPSKILVFWFTLLQVFCRFCVAVTVSLNLLLRWSGNLSQFKYARHGLLQWSMDHIIGQYMSLINIFGQYVRCPSSHSAEVYIFKSSSWNQSKQINYIPLMSHLRKLLKLWGMSEK